MLRRGLPRLSRLAELRTRITCARRGSEGAKAIAASVAPVVRPVLTSSDDRLLELVQTGACDAAIVDADGVGRLVAGRGALLGPVTARESRPVTATSWPSRRGGPIAVAEVSRALQRMRLDGTMHRLMRTWLGIDPARLRPLR